LALPPESAITPVTHQPSAASGADVDLGRHPALASVIRQRPWVIDVGLDIGNAGVARIGDRLGEDVARSESDTMTSARWLMH